MTKGASPRLGRATPRIAKYPEHLTHSYTVDVTTDVPLGQGAHSVVYECVHVASGRRRAVKRMSASEDSAQDIAQEINIMRYLQHECIVKCYEVFLEPRFVNVIVDFFSGGDLIAGLRKHRSEFGALASSELARITCQMVSAVAHMHHVGIIHRDVKGENFLSDRSDIGNPMCRVALGDFGTATWIDDGELLSAQMGTKAYWAPEVWQANYDRKADVWAVGITVFVLLAGCLPYSDEEMNRFQFEDVCLSNSTLLHLEAGSAVCTDFIIGCLNLQRTSRFSLEAASKHVWLTTTLCEKRGVDKLRSLSSVVAGSVCTQCCGA